MAENKKKRKALRQSWEPGGWVKLLRGVWSVVFSAAKIAVGALMTVLCILIVCGVVFVGLLGDYLEEDIIPNADLALENFDLDQTSFLYAVNSDGEIEMIQELSGNVDRKWVSIDEIPENLIHAAVAIEDKRFYEHQGVDWITTVKACVNMFFGGSTQFGGSTITQQLIKNLLLPEDETADDVTVQRKVLEIFRAEQFEKTYDKNVIMEWYLNTIYLGENCYGVKSAAAEYFGKELKDLTLAECASLIGITKNPSKYDPYITSKGVDQPSGRDRNRERQLDVLEKMLDQGWITEEEYEEAVNQTMIFQSGTGTDTRVADCKGCDFVGIVEDCNLEEDDKYHCPQCGLEIYDIEEDSSSVYSWFVEVVLDDVAMAMAEQDGVEWNKTTKETYLQLIKRGGYHIYTTMDMDVQAQLDEIYTDLDQIPSTKNAQQLLSSMVIIDNTTGDIVAIAGNVGEKTSYDAFNHATDEGKQIGSSMKPLTVYAPAFEAGGFSPATVISDLPLYYDEDGTPFPRNAERVYNFSRTILSGVNNSTNTIAVNTLDQIGLNYSFDYAKQKLHLSGLVDEYVDSSGRYYSDLNYSPLALGALTSGVTVREVTAAYAAFANGGVYREARTFTKVYNSSGELVLSNEQDSERIFSQKTVDYMNYCLSFAVQWGTGSVGKLSNVTAAAKSGTTTSSKDRVFAGFTGYYTAAVWCGFKNPEEIKLVGDTSNPAGRLWKKVMEPLHKGLTDIPLYNADKMVSVTVCMDCGKVATNACKADIRSGEVSRTYTALVYPEDVPEEECDCHVMVDYCTTGGGVANEYCKKFAQVGAATIKQRALVKMTQEMVEALAAAGENGLKTVYLQDNYIYLVDELGNDMNFRGIYGTANAGINAPYAVCTAHTKAAWDAYCQQHPGVNGGGEDEDDNSGLNFDWPW